MLNSKAIELDYRQANAANALLPNPSVLASSNWHPIHLEVFQEPKFEIAEHQHTMHVIACGLPDLNEDSQAATGERWLDGKLERERRRAGDLAIIPAGIPHRCNWQTSVQFMILAIEPALLQQVGQDLVNPDRIELMPQFMNESDALIQGIFSTLREELECDQIGGALLIDSLKTTLAIHLLRNYCTTQPKPSNQADGLSQARLQRVTEYIHDSLHQDLKLVELSAIAQLSPYHFLRLFKQRMGITPHQYILQRRLEKATSLLRHSELSIAAIAVQTGFSDQSHLTRCFKRTVGVTPKQLQA
ncbi:AraC family transcriptional regulator [Stenomitos frigidus]|uniref:AraC family transcriptional regulator n=1 Tax=Stenomitos frigidus ULC18 TaxID=2107698 RepID=A0A2T1E371_9CYAN|nr:AraC family transcriptional regulator [Stenomitos frigidus]PSB27170.1 AraC family transcriptional regulator [Stenomitos frigidus ULC18]